MILNSTASYDFIKKVERLKSPNLVINTTNLNDQDLQDFVNLSEEIVRNARERRSQRKHCKARSNTVVATMTREEIFESTNIDDDKFLTALEYETTYDTNEDRALVNSIENIMKYFGEDVNVRGENFVKDNSIHKLTKGKVASVVASFRNKCGLTPSPRGKRKTQHKEVRSTVQDLKRKYETTTDIDTSSSPKDLKSKSPKLSRKTKVKQMALLFNNKFNSMMNNSAPTRQTPGPESASTDSISSPTCSSTPNPKPNKMQTKFPKFVAKQPSPKPSPFFRRKQLQKSSSIIISGTNSPVTKRKQMQKEASTTCLVAESVFSQLSVKDKALLYNKFIADMSKQNPKFIKHAAVLESNVEKEMQRGEVVFEKQVSVKHLRDCWEAKLTPTKTFSKTLQRFKSSTPKISLDAAVKSKEYEDILQSDLYTSQLEDDSQELQHVSSLTVVLKPSPKSKRWLEKNKSLRKQKDASSFEDDSAIEPSQKRTQRMIRASSCVEPLAPPKKIRRTQHESLAPKTFFQNQHLEKLFYHWLKENNGVAFDIARVNNKKNVIEIVPKNTSENVLPAEEIDKILEAAINKLESDKLELSPKAADATDAMILIKNVIENENNQENDAIIEVELPLEVDVPKAETKERETEDSDLGLASITKTTSEGSQTDRKLHDVSNRSAKMLRRRKLPNSLAGRKQNYRKTIFSTDSDSDCKTKSKKMHSYTLPKSKNCSNYVKRLIFKTLNNSAPSEQTRKFNNEFCAELDTNLIRQVNSPSKVKTAYTLTVISSSSPHSESDFCDADLSKISHLKEVSRSWPSLVHAVVDNDAKLLKDKAATTEFTDLTDNKMNLKQQILLMDSFIDQGFETGSNAAESPLKLPRKVQYDINTGQTKRQNSTNSSTLREVRAVQQLFTPKSETAKQDINIFAPKSRVDCNTADSEEIINTPSSIVTRHSLNNPSNPPLDSTQKQNCSHFWITSGDFTASIAIHRYESDRLMLLSNIYIQKAMENKEMCFGIDDQQFCLIDSNATSDEIIKRVPKENDCSQYWFSTGGVLMCFSGKQMTTKKIISFFNYIREFVAETGSLSFGIDGYEFSTACQITLNSNSSFNPNISTHPVSPLKTSDLDHSDIDSEGGGQSHFNFSGLKQHLDIASSNGDDALQQPAPEQISKDAKDFNISIEQTVDKQALESKYNSVPEMLKMLQNQQSKLKFLKERILNGTYTTDPKKLIDESDSSDYMKQLKSIITAIDNIDQVNGFSGCSIQELESFMFSLRRYADLCLANCTAHIEKILNVVLSQRLNAGPNQTA